MRRPAAKQSVLRYPLTAIFAAEGNVRVLREILLHGGELGAPMIASRVKISRQHVLKILASLTSLGIVEAVGLSGHPTYRANPAHPLHGELARLFRSEDGRFQAARDAVRLAAPKQPAPTAIWLYGSVARGEDTARSDIDVAVVIDTPHLERLVSGMRERLSPAERTLQVNYSVLGIDFADVLRLSAGDPWWVNVSRDAIPLLGSSPERLAACLRRATPEPSTA